GQELLDDADHLDRPADHDVGGHGGDPGDLHRRLPERPHAPRELGHGVRGAEGGHRVPGGREQAFERRPEARGRRQPVAHRPHDVPRGFGDELLGREQVEDLLDGSRVDKCVGDHARHTSVSATPRPARPIASAPATSDSSYSRQVSSTSPPAASATRVTPPSTSRCRSVAASSADMNSAPTGPTTGATASSGNESTAPSADSSASASDPSPVPSSRNPSTWTSIAPSGMVCPLSTLCA